MFLLSRLKSLIKRKGGSTSHVPVENCENRKGYVTEELRTCPYCAGHKDKFELLCYYNNEDFMWSDFRHELPQVAVPSLIQKCPYCGKYYITKASHVLINDTTDFEFIDPVSWGYFKQSYEAFSKLEKDNVVDYNHRLRMLGAYNDEFCRTQNPPSPTEEDILMFKDNVLHLMEYLSAPLLKAEMYREIGLFDECFKQLDLVNDEGDGSQMGYKETIAHLAKQKKTEPFGWKPE